jgi:hypothetical protein
MTLVYMRQNARRVTFWEKSSVAKIPCRSDVNAKILESVRIGHRRSTLLTKETAWLFLTLNGRNIPFVNSVKYIGVIFDKRMTWRLHIEKIEAKAFETFIRLYSLSKSEQLNVYIKLTLHETLIRSVMTTFVPPGNLRQKPIYSNCSACKWRFFAPLVVSLGAHWSAIGIWLSKFRTFTHNKIIQPRVEAG